MHYIDSHTHRFHHHRKRRRQAFDNHSLNILLIKLLSIADVTVGVWLSMSVGDWQWFARSGAMLVVLGILLTSSQIIENSRRLKTRHTLHPSHFKHDYAEELKQRKLAHASILEEDIWHDGLRGLYLLIIGTLIWGFGDLVGWLF